MNISDLLIKDNILLNLSVSSKLDAFKELSSKLLINNCINDQKNILMLSLNVNKNLVQILVLELLFHMLKISL